MKPHDNESYWQDRALQAEHDVGTSTTVIFILCIVILLIALFMFTGFFR